MSQSEVSLRRNGRLQACEPCRRSKHRCDHSSPICNRCVVLRKKALCVYHPAPMTKVRRGSVASPARPPRLLPETRTPLQTTGSRSPPACEAPRIPLFEQPGSQYEMSSFSAVFRENQEQIGADLLDVREKLLNSRRKVNDDPARMKLAVETLRAFPSSATCQLLLVPLPTIHQVTVSPKITTHCLNSVWLTFGYALKGSRSNNKLSKMADELFNNGKSTAHPDNDHPWVNWFAGSPLRWEMIGMLFCSFGLSMMRLQDWDPIFSQPGKSRKAASRQMKECADACLSLRNRDYPKKDLVYCLSRNIGLLHSQITGDDSDDLAMYEGLGVATYLGAGLHCLPENGPLDSQSEYRKTISAAGYYNEKTGALFNARPPAISRCYCSYQLPLDLTEDQWYGNQEDLATAASQLDENGWNTSGHLSTITWLRARCMIVPIREAILEISLGKNMEVAPGRIDQLIEQLSTVTSSYPPWLQYSSINQWSSQSFSTERNDHFYIITRIQTEVLQTRFLLERLRQSSSTVERNQDLFNVAQQLMDVTLSLWIDRDRLLLYQSVFHWLAVDFGIPAAGILCVELLYAVRHPHTQDKIVVSRSDTIQSLTMFIAFLGWVRVDDGNYELCRNFMEVIRNILNHVLEAPQISGHLEENDARIGELEGAESNQLDLDWSDLNDPDWLNLLNTMDWTQGFAQ